MDCTLPGSSVHGILQAKILEWVAMPSSRGSSWPSNWTQVTYVSCIGRRVLYHWCYLGSPKVRFSQFSHSVMSNSLLPRGLQHTRLPCPSLTPRACSNSLESVMPSNHLILCCPFSYHFQSFPAPGSFPMSQFFTSDGQSIGVSASASVLPMNIQDWFPLGLTGWISLQSKGLSRVFSNTTIQRHQFFGAQLSLWSNSHIHTWLLGKA